MLALWKILVKYKMLLIGGVKITVIISVLTILFGLIFGTLMAFMKMSKVRLLRCLQMLMWNLFGELPYWYRYPSYFMDCP